MIFETIDEWACEGSELIQFAAKTPTIKPPGGGHCFTTFTTIPVPKGTKFEDAAARSLAFILDDQQRLAHPYSHTAFRDNQTGEYAWSWYTRDFDDGSRCLTSVSVPPADAVDVSIKVVTEMELVAQSCRLNIGLGNDYCWN